MRRRLILSPLSCVKFSIATDDVPPYLNHTPKPALRHVRELHDAAKITIAKLCIAEIIPMDYRRAIHILSKRWKDADDIGRMLVLNKYYDAAAFALAGELESDDSIDFERWLSGM